MLKYEIHQDAGLVVLEVIGDVTFHEFCSIFASVADDPAYSVDCQGVADLRRVNTGLQEDEAAQLAEHVVSNRLSRGRWAVLASSPMTTALSMFYEEEVAGQHSVGVFSTIDAASEFLSLDLRKVGLAEL